MKSSLAVLFFLGIVVVFSNAEVQNDFEILTPEGNYKKGSMYMWNPILDRIIKITMAPGSGYLKTIKTHVEALEQAFQVKDDAALSQIFGTIGPLYKRAQPNILNKKLGDVVYKAGEACIQVSKKLKTTGMTLVELAIFEKQALTEISALLPKAPKHH